MKENRELVNALIYFALSICFFIGAGTGFRNIGPMTGVLCGIGFACIGVVWIVRYKKRK